MPRRSLPLRWRTRLDCGGEWSAWRLADGVVGLEVVVPPGASAEIHLSDGRVEQVGSGTHRFS
ncbi:MAG TPA: alpha-L-rhamnosidase C-terminal domain-containing protein [Roseiflexaceae bacterium]|nr:alpha-L-rhamnosidase C-terminal domain-containing protein [Roseiflexaceae bacterium]